MKEATHTINPPTMMYNFEQMICTDPDELQFTNKVSESVWEYCQITNLTILDLFRGDADSFVKAYMANEVVDGINVRETMDNGYSVVSETIDLSRYTDDEIDNELRPFGYTFHEEAKNSIKEIYPDSWKQICCECIFENDVQGSIFENDVQGSIFENDVQGSIFENVLEQAPKYYN